MFLCRVDTLSLSNTHDLQQVTVLSHISVVLCFL